MKHIPHFLNNNVRQIENVFELLKRSWDIDREMAVVYRDPLRFLKIKVH